jgi:hypothetical protein
VKNSNPGKLIDVIDSGFAGAAIVLKELDVDYFI